MVLLLAGTTPQDAPLGQNRKPLGLSQGFTGTREGRRGRCIHCEDWMFAHQMIRTDTAVVIRYNVFEMKKKNTEKYWFEESHLEKSLRIQEHTHRGRPEKICKRKIKRTKKKIDRNERTERKGNGEIAKRRYLLNITICKLPNWVGGSRAQQNKLTAYAERQNLLTVCKRPDWILHSHAQQKSPDMKNAKISPR